MINPQWFELPMSRTNFPWSQRCSSHRSSTVFCQSDHSTDVIPPSTGKMTPVIMSVLSLKRNKVAFTMSSSSVKRNIVDSLSQNTDNSNCCLKQTTLWKMPKLFCYILYIHPCHSKTTVISIENSDP